MTQEIKVSKAGVNVGTATEPNDFIFDSTLNTFKVITQGSATGQVVSSNPTVFTYAHNLGYIPNFYAFAKFPDGKTTLPDSIDFTWQPNVSDGYGAFETSVDGTSIYFSFSKASGTYGVDISYYVFEATI